MIRVVSLIVLASLALPSAAAGRRVLLAWLHDEKAIEPIVMLDPLTKAMVRPREDFAFARSYTLSIDGKESGTVRTGERTELGCVSIAAKAEVKGDGNFATNFAPRAAGSIREATADETRRMRRWARQFLVQRGIPKASAEKIEAVFDVVDRGDGDPLVVGYAVTNVYMLRAGSVFVIARLADLTETSLVPQLALFDERDPDSAQGKQPLFGTIDLDGDGLAELITQRSHKEGYDYFVYRRINGRWTAFEGGGSGC